MATPATVARIAAATMARRAAAATEERKLLGTRKQFGCLTAPEQARLVEAWRILGH